MKKILLFLSIAATFLTGARGQTISKTATVTAAHIGEPFEYLVTIGSISNLNSVAAVTDDLSPGLDYLGYELSPALQALVAFNYCTGITPSFSGTMFQLSFSSCSGSISGAGNLWFKIKVRFNSGACGQSAISNVARLGLTGGAVIASQVCSVNVKSGDPYTLQKTFRSMTNGVLTYDVRITSSTGNFDNLDFGSANLTDHFIFPGCVDVDPGQSSVAYIPDETVPGNEVAMNAVPAAGAGTLDLAWPMPAGIVRSSYLFLVKIKVLACACNETFPLQNSATFTATDWCGKPVGKTAICTMPGVKCINGDLICPPIEADSLCFSKKVILNLNNLNLTMNGCAGHYDLVVKNCSQGFTYTDFSLTDILPAALVFDGPVTVTGPATVTQSGSLISVLSSGVMNPGDVVTITIPFKVNTPLDNHFIRNCANITVNANDGTSTFPITRTACDIGIRTVPNAVALRTTKFICNAPNHSCGGLTINNNLPGDYVEYALHVYNYGTVDATNFSIADPLPDYFSIQNPASDVKVYKVLSNSAVSDCGVPLPANDITGTAAITTPSGGSNMLVINFPGNTLKHFTCGGIVHYIVKVRVRISNSVTTGVYYNQFKTTYTDASNGVVGAQYSNQVSSTVTLENLLITDKVVDSVQQDCAAKTKTVFYKIKVTNLGTIPVNVSITDAIMLPPGLSVIGAYQAFKKCSYAPSIVCTPAFFTPTTVSSTGFTASGLSVLPCNTMLVTYRVVFNTNLLPKGATVEACNRAIIKASLPASATPGFNPGVLVTSNIILANKFLAAATNEEKLAVLETIKAVKSGIPIKGLKPLSPGAAGFIALPLPVNAGSDTVGKCVSFQDCMNGKTSGCFSEASTSFGFAITGMSNTGIISTTLTLPATKKVKKIEYVLTDIRMINPCSGLFCWACTKDVTGLVNTTTPGPIGALTQQYVFQPWAQHKEKNKVEWSGPASYLSAVSKSFQLPVANLNCTGTLEFVVTAIVYFDDCSVCYVSDNWDYNASHTYILNYKPG